MPCAEPFRSMLCCRLSAICVLLHSSLTRSSLSPFCSSSSRPVIRTKRTMLATAWRSGCQWSRGPFRNFPRRSRRSDHAPSQYGPSPQRGWDKSGSSSRYCRHCGHRKRKWVTADASRPQAHMSVLLAPMLTRYVFSRFFRVLSWANTLASALSALLSSS